MPPQLLSNRRLLFVGSGLSTALGISPWRTLLERTARKEVPPPDLDRIMDLLCSPGQEYNAADELARLLGRGRLEATLIRVIREEEDRLSSLEVNRFTSVLLG
jgi:hypothetical protein